MAGKSTVPKSVHRRVIQLAKRGMSQMAIADSIGYSLYTVRKALDPNYADKQNALQRATGKKRYAARKRNPDYIKYQAAVSASDANKERCRNNMRRLRAARKQQVSQ